MYDIYYRGENESLQARETLVSSDMYLQIMPLTILLYDMFLMHTLVDCRELEKELEISRYFFFNIDPFIILNTTFHL